MSNSSIMSVRELIDSAFGEQEKNVVNFKIIQTVLYLLARQLRVLERRVEVVLPYDYKPSSTSLSVTEIKMQATVPKKKKKIAKSEGQSTTGRKVIQGLADELSSTAKKYTGKGIKSVAGIIQDTNQGMEGTRQQSSAIPTKLNKDEKDFVPDSEKDFVSADKTVISKTTSEDATEKTTSLKTQITTDKTSSSGRTTTEKSTTKKSTTITRVTGLTETLPDSISTQVTSTDKQNTTSKSTRTGKSVTEGTKISSSEVVTGDILSIDDTTTSSGKKTTSKSTTKSTTTSSKVASGSEKGKVSLAILDDFEQSREKELRVINQRKYSREEPQLSPTPMASIDSMEVQHEKLLVVERLPSGEIPGRIQRLSVVTQEEFLELMAAVKRLESKFGPISTPGFVENAKLMEELRRGASLTDAMAALQLSARIEAAEKTLEQMLTLVTELAKKTPGIDTSSTKSSKSSAAKGNLILEEGEDTQVESELKDLESDIIQGITGKGIKKKSKLEGTSSKQASQVPDTTNVVTQETQALPDWITIDQLDEAMEELYNNTIKVVTAITTRTSVNADTALKTVTKLESKLTSSLNLDDRMEEVEKIIAEYAEHVNALDTDLSSQMTYYQEQLTQMQYDLDTGLEAMAEALANTGGDSNAVAELNSHFTSLQMDFDNATTRQRDLQDSQNELALDLQNLWKQIEILRDIKSDRDEVADALKDKVGIGALNGILSQTQFDAVRGDFEKRIGAAYDKFNNQEFVWQKAIDDLLRHLNEKADLMQVLCLRDDINKHLEKLKNRMNTMLEIVGEPRTAALARKLNRDGTCLSCSSPAHMTAEEPSTVPALPPLRGPRPTTIGAETIETAKETDGLCYPGYPLPHLVDPRAHFCNRYCGGSHTLLPATAARVPAGLLVTTLEKKNTTALGTDGKMYLVDEKYKKKPCIPCNQPKTPSYCTRPMEAENAPNQDRDMTPPDFQYLTAKVPCDSVSYTPPVFLED